MTERVKEKEKWHQETAEAERQEDCTDQVAHVKLFTLETVILPYDKVTNDKLQLFHVASNANQLKGCNN